MEKLPLLIRERRRMSEFCGRRAAILIVLNLRDLQFGLRITFNFDISLSSANGIGNNFALLYLVCLADKSPSTGRPVKDGAVNARIRIILMCIQIKIPVCRRLNSIL